jgi:hypothetical protein
MTYKDCQNLYSKKGYKFRTGKMELNIFGIRSKNSQSDKYDDLGGVAYIDEEGKEQLFHFWMTTDPGKYYLTNPMNKEGCIIVVPGQYLQVYGLGLHSGKYEALVQKSPMHYVRDNNKDTELDFRLYREPKSLRELGKWEMRGTNFHRSSAWNVVPFIGRYSAGCQVVQKPETFDKIMNLVKESIKAGYKRFDYTLFEE